MARLFDTLDDRSRAALARTSTQLLESLVPELATDSEVMAVMTRLVAINVGFGPGQMTMFQFAQSLPTIVWCFFASERGETDWMPDGSQEMGFLGSARHGASSFVDLGELADDGYWDPSPGYHLVAA